MSEIEQKITVQCKRCKVTRETSSKLGLITCTNCGRKIKVQEEKI